MVEVVLDWTEKINHFRENVHISSELIYGNYEDDAEEILISIAIPTYNRPKLLRNAIDSALAQMGDYRVEIIVVDDYAEKNPENDKLLKEFTDKHSNIFYFRNEKNLGIMGNWNRCFELARGKWVLLLHEDDVLYNSYLESILPWLEKTNCTMAGVFHCDIYDDEFEGNVDKNYGKKLGKNQKILQKIRKGKPFVLKYTDIFANIYPSPVCSIHKRETVLELGGFDDLNNGGAGDEKFFVNQIYNGKTIILPEILAFRGIGSNDSMKPEIPKQGILSKYKYGKHAIQKLGKRKKIRQLNLDVSVRYMAKSIEARYNKEVDLSDFLLEIGVPRYIIRMPLFILRILKYIPLLVLIFRSTGEE